MASHSMEVSAVPLLSLSCVLMTLTLKTLIRHVHYSPACKPSSFPPSEHTSAQSKAVEEIGFSPVNAVLSTVLPYRTIVFCEHRTNKVATHRSLGAWLT